MKGGYGVGGKNKSGGAAGSYNHCKDSSNNTKGYQGPKGIGASVHKAKPDLKTPATTGGSANKGGK